MKIWDSVYIYKPLLSSPLKSEESEEESLDDSIEDKTQDLKKAEDVESSDSEV